MKGDFLLMDLIKLIDHRCKDIHLNVVFMNPYIEFPNLSNPTIRTHFIKGPVERSKIHELLQKTDIYVDASLNEGFGLTALEALSAGCVPVVSNSFGIEEYMQDAKNGYIIQEVNNVEKYFEKVELLIKKPKIFCELKEEGEKNSKKFDYDQHIEEYIEYFKNINHDIISVKTFTEKEQKILNTRTSLKTGHSKVKKIAYRLDKILPKVVKEKFKKVITSLYNMYQH